MLPLWCKIVRDMLISSYGAYMSSFGILVACAEYDNYRMRQICNNAANKHNPNGITSIVANNKFMCPFTKIDIYKYNMDTCDYKYIVSETYMTMPPIIELGNEVFINYDKNNNNINIKVGKKLIPLVWNNGIQIK